MGEALRAPPSAAVVRLLDDISDVVSEEGWSAWVLCTLAEQSS